MVRVQFDSFPFFQCLFRDLMLDGDGSFVFLGPRVAVSVTDVFPGRSYAMPRLCMRIYTDRCTDSSDLFFNFRGSL